MTRTRILVLIATIGIAVTLATHFGDGTGESAEPALAGPSAATTDRPAGPRDTAAPNDAAAPLAAVAGIGASPTGAGDASLDQLRDLVLVHANPGDARTPEERAKDAEELLEEIERRESAGQLLAADAQALRASLAAAAAGSRPATP